MRARDSLFSHSQFLAVSKFHLKSYLLYVSHHSFKIPSLTAERWSLFSLEESPKPLFKFPPCFTAPPIHPQNEKKPFVRRLQTSVKPLVTPAINNSRNERLFCLHRTSRCGKMYSLNGQSVVLLPHQMRSSNADLKQERKNASKTST
jgi:hypothetical protein